MKSAAVIEFTANLTFGRIHRAALNPSCYRAASPPLLSSRCAAHRSRESTGLLASALEFSVRPRSASAARSYDLVWSRYRLKAFITGASLKLNKKAGRSLLFTCS